MNTLAPENETTRLEALHALAILDTAPEPAFDELAALAASVCQAPIALISLVDADRQWFKARVGSTLTETPRDISSCAHAIRGRELFAVPDAAADERFAHNPLVTAAEGIRFYAGAPLVTPEGHALGALCVMDRRPRELAAAQAQALRTLSHHIVLLFRARRDLAGLARMSRERLRAEHALA